MLVKDLIKILEQCDPEMPVATHANNHTNTNDFCRVCLLQNGSKNYIIIGNVGRKNLNWPNEFIIKELDNGNKIPKDYPKWDGQHWIFDKE